MQTVRMREVSIVSLRVVRDESVPIEADGIVSSSSVYDLMRPLIGDSDRESLWVICLDARSRPTCISQVALGSSNSLTIPPREIFKIVFMSNAVGLVIVHNHPSGDTCPSREDMALTHRLQRAADILGLRLHDHLIIGPKDFLSFNDEGWLKVKPEDSDTPEGLIRILDCLAQAKGHSRQKTSPTGGRPYSK